MPALGELIEALITHDTAMEELGLKIGKLYTDHGFPIDMALDRIDLPMQRKIVLVNSALGWLIQHKRNSGATDAAIERQRRFNRTAIERFINTGEAGIY